MKNHVYKLALMVVLGSGFALAQTMPQNPPAVPQTQQPPTADQNKPPTTSTANVQSDIQSALQKDPSLASANISVQVSDAGIELSGTVPTKDAKDAAEQIAKSHSGGLDVKNNIKVTGKISDNPK
jgi:osmotically-inducible protein OsmY